MARRFIRRRRDADEQPAPPADPDNVDLGAAEHAWWAQRDLSEPWSTRASTDEPARDVLADHLGEHWRAEFGLDESKEPTGPEVEPGAEAEAGSEVDASDPYAVLGVDRGASWETIVATHRSEARRHHPDRMFGRPEVEVRRSEQRIRDINVAFRELRIRRGR